MGGSLLLTTILRFQHGHVLYEEKTGEYTSLDNGQSALTFPPGRSI